MIPCTNQVSHLSTRESLPRAPVLGQTLQHLGHCQPLHQEVRDHNRLNPLLSSLWAGDFNWDINSSGFSHQLRDFIIRIGLVSVWETHPVSHTHIHTNMQSMSTLDHFMVDPALLPAIIDAGALHLGCNLSRHSPIMIKLDIGNLPHIFCFERDICNFCAIMWIKIISGA